jgi:hypothetical protein
MIPYDWNNDENDETDFNYDPDITSSSYSCWDPNLDSIFGTPPEPLNHDKLIKDIRECTSVNDFLKRIGDDLHWEDLR